MALGHEFGSGAACLKCKDKCDGFELHFWRFVRRRFRLNHHITLFKPLLVSKPGLNDADTDETEKSLLSKTLNPLVTIFRFLDNKNLLLMVSGLIK